MIFYFSGTGNSHWAATLLGKHLNEHIVSISELTETDTKFVLEKDEIVGFVFPVHGWRVPRIVSDFMQTLEFKEGNFQNKNSHYTFCLLTAGDSIGRTMERFVSELKEVKTESTLELNAVEAVIMPESYVGLPGMNVDKPEKELLENQFFWDFNSDNTPKNWEIKGEQIFKREKRDSYHSDTGFGVGIKTGNEKGFLKQTIDLPKNDVTVGDEIECQIHYTTISSPNNKGPLRLAFRWLNDNGNVVQSNEDAFINNPKVFFGKMKSWGTLTFRTICPEAI